jgi:hypothetical protein
MRRYLGLIGAVGVCLTAPVAGQTTPPPPAAPLLERLVCHWTMTGTVRGRPATYQLDVAWVLQHRFVDLHMEDVQHTPPRYEARVFIGPDTLPGRVLEALAGQFRRCVLRAGGHRDRGRRYVDAGLSISGWCVPRHLRSRRSHEHVDDPVGCSRRDGRLETFCGLPGGASVSRRGTHEAESQSATRRLC